jgi:hypothetical protein
MGKSVDVSGEASGGGCFYACNMVVDASLVLAVSSVQLDGFLFGQCAHV